MDDAVRLAAGSLQAVVLPELGGRLISLRDRGREFLWRDPALLDDDLRRRVPVVLPSPGAGMDAWQNWGGDKSWPAPQASGGTEGWHGPPDPVLDGGRYRVLEAAADRVRLQSEVDPRTGLQQERAIAVEGRAVRVTTTITNRAGAGTVRFAPWEVMQVALSAEDEATGTVEVETAPGGRTVQLGRWWGFSRVNEHERFVRVELGHAVAKLGFVGATGRVRCRFADGAELALEFAASPDAPDASPFQLWQQTPVDDGLAALDGWRPEHRLIELEPVGALTDLPPGASASLTAVWTATAAAR